MKLNEVKQYTLGVLRGTFKNKNILDDISAEGRNLRYKGTNLGDSYMTLGSEEYSTEERIIGKWEDGRPLYRKTIIDTVPITSKDGTEIGKNTLTNVNNIDYVVNFQAIITDNNIYQFLCPWINGSGYRCVSFYEPNTNSIRIINGVKSFSDMKILIHLTYVKSTDIADSFTEDMLSAPNNFIDGNTYSENEVVIGQWINGKPIYRKVVKIASPTNGGKYNHNILNLEEVVKVSGYVKNGSSFEPINTNANRDYYTGIYDISDTYFYYTCGSWKTTNLNVVFEYTKTTDEPQDMTITSTLTTTATDEEVAEVFA